MRRLVSIPALLLLAPLLVLTIPIWVPLTLVVDLCTAPRRLPRLRLIAFATWWSWLEVCGIVASAALFAVGRARAPGPNYALQRWWANGLVVALRHTCRLHITVRGAEELVPGPVVVLPRHASLADALLSAWLVTSLDLAPRYVLKRELRLDPCLDLVGHRLPNHFLDRTATDSSAELTALRDLAATVREPDDAVVIFPEGTRANPEKRARSLERIGERDPERAARLAALQHCNAPRPAGTLAVLDGAPEADVVFVAHAGFEGLDTFGGILAAIPPPAPVIVDCRRVDRADVPDGVAARTEWLDREWLAVDDRVAALAVERATMGRRP